MSIFFTPNLTILHPIYLHSLSALMFLSYLLKNGEIVRFKPHEIAHFKEWLNHFKVRDITVNNGLPHVDRTSDLSKSKYGFFNFIKRRKWVKKK